MDEENYKYTARGHAVTVLEKTTRGFLVCSVLEDEDGVYVGEGEPFLCERIFDAPPEEKLHDRIKQLEARCNELVIRKEELEKGLKELEGEEKALKFRCSRHEALRHVFDFIDGNVTHYVTARWSEVEIIPASKVFETERRDPDAVKLLTLFGKSKGQLDWRLNDYSDGSGCNYVVQPARSIEEARGFAKDLWEAKLSAQVQNHSRKAMEAALSFGATLPEGYAAKVAAAERASATKALENARAAMANAEADFAALNKKEAAQP